MGPARVSTPPSLPPGTEVGGYVLDERIGAGGFGEVFRAHHPVIGRVVAIKLLHARYSHDADAVARFVDEARAVNRISHPGIIEVFDFGRAHDREYFVMELIEGRSLRDLLAERERLPVAEALPLLRRIAEAVDAAHAAGIAHRDLKPENVFVLADGRTKLIDFGLAKLMREQDSVTETGSVFGTPLYMSPEQCRGRGVDTRTDIYSFGALAYHMLVGAPPFGGEPIELALHHLNDPPPPPNISRVVDRVVLALLAKDPSERPSTLVAAVAALEGSATLRVRRTRRTKRIVVGVLALAFAGSGIAYVLTRTASSSSTCTSAADRIATLAPKRAAIATRFAGSAKALGIANTKLDAASAKWSQQWDAACTANRDADPLLYGQRVACLENAFADLQSDIDGLGSYEPAQLADFTFEGLGTGTGGRSLTDCANPAVLRAQVPPPPAAVRERVAAKLLEIQRATADGWEGLAKRDLPRIDRAATRLDVLAKEIEALDPPSAGAAILVRLEMLDATAWDSDIRRLTGIRKAREDAARRLEANRDDIRLAQAHIAIAWDAVSLAHDTTGLDAATSAIERARQAVERAGKPIRAMMSLLAMQGDLAIKRGRFDEATDAYRKSLAITREEDLDASQIQQKVVMALARGEHHAEARAEAERYLTNVVAIYGPDHTSIAGPHKDLAMAAQLAGDLPRALEHERRAAQLFAAAHDPAAKRTPWGRTYVLDLELQLGQSPEDAVAALKAISGLGTTPPRQNPDGIATARRAGLYAEFVFGASRTDVTGELEHLDHAATLAFHRGEDFVPLAKLVERRCGCTAWMPLSRWLALVGDSNIDVKMLALEKTYDSSPSAIAYSGIVLAHLGRWSEARTKLEAARAAPSWERQADLADLATWLGLAKLHTNDPAGARVAFEEALAVISITFDGFDGFSYTTPVAQRELAKLVAADDPARAAALERRAVAGFARLRKPSR